MGESLRTLPEELLYEEDDPLLLPGEISRGVAWWSCRRAWVAFTRERGVVRGKRGGIVFVFSKLLPGGSFVFNNRHGTGRGFPLRLFY